MPSLEAINIVTNQGGIPQYISERDFKSKFNSVIMFITEYCNVPTYGRYCDSIDKFDPRHKPNTRMLEELMMQMIRPVYRNFPDMLNKGIEEYKKSSLMIGDASGKPGDFSDSDKKTAENFGIDYIDVEDFIKSS